MTHKWIIIEQNYLCIGRWRKRIESKRTSHPSREFNHLVQLRSESYSMMTCELVILQQLSQWYVFGELCITWLNHFLKLPQHMEYNASPLSLTWIEAIWHVYVRMTIMAIIHKYSSGWARTNAIDPTCNDGMKPGRCVIGSPCIINVHAWLWSDYNRCIKIQSHFVGWGSITILFHWTIATSQQRCLDRRQP